MLLSSSIHSASEWLYYKEYPWVYDAKTEDWLYLQGGTDKKIYAYRASTKNWEEFSVPDVSRETFDTNNPPSILSVDLNSSNQLEMLWVEPGTFTMGSPNTEPGRRDRETWQQVTLTRGFYLGECEVTQGQYEAVMTGNIETNSSGDVISATPSNWHGNPNRPVEKVSWDDVQVFLTRLNAQQSANIPSGWAYVLPTETQWEYACRAGTTTIYSWGNDINSSRANYNWDGDHNSGNDFNQTRDVGQYAANPWGFFDLHGNVSELTADWYGAVWFSYPSGSLLVTRGGSWQDRASHLRSADRFILSPPSHRAIGLGFRVGFQSSK